MTEPQRVQAVYDESEVGGYAAGYWYGVACARRKQLLLDLHPPGEFDSGCRDAYAAIEKYGVDVPFTQLREAFLRAACDHFGRDVRGEIETWWRPWVTVET